jgi:hypothetical protein
MKIMSNISKRAREFFICLSFLVFIPITNGNAAVIFEDDFNDNVFNTTIWEEYINNNPWGTCIGSGLGIWEENGELKCGIDCGRTWSYWREPIYIGMNWGEIRVTGKWKMAPTRTGVFGVILYNGLYGSKNYIYPRYNDYTNGMEFYDSGSSEGYLSSILPSEYVSFEIRASRNYWSYSENSILVQEFMSSTFEDATELTLAIGGWDGSHGATEYVFFDDIKVELLPREVPLDIKPNSCPNPLNIRSKGILPVAILGTEDFDATQIDPASIRLLGIAPIRSNLEDVATPFEPFVGREDPYGCSELGPDGFTDLTLKFKTQEIVKALGEVDDGDVLVLELTGECGDGAPIIGEDIVVIMKKGK